MDQSGQAEPTPGAPPGRWGNRFARFVVASTLFLIFAGGMVTSTSSGLAVPDWPLSYGKVFPEQFREGFQRIGLARGVFYEHGHRMVAATVGLLTVALAVWLGIAERRRWVRWLAAGAVGVVVVQGILGGVTVLLRLPTAVSVSHAGLANLFLLIAVALAVVTGRWWGAVSARVSPGTSGLRNLGMVTTGLIYVQILLGAVMRHTGSGFAIPDFPLALGRLVPPLDDPHVAIHYAHRVGALAVTLLVGALLWRTFQRRRAPDADGLLGPGAVLGLLLVTQVTLGAFTVWTAKGLYVTTFHVVGGSATLAAAFVLTLHAARWAGTSAEGRRPPIRDHALPPPEAALPPVGASSQRSGRGGE